MGDLNLNRVGYKWRSSKWFIVATVTIALFIESFLYGFLVPILPYMFRNRLNLDLSQTQRLTSAVLSLHGFVSAVSGPVIGHFADKTLDRRTPLLLSLAGCIAGTIMVACSRMLPFLILGRILQGTAGSAAWIVGLATVADTLGQDNMGAVMGVIMSFVNAGMITGPMVSGIMLEVAGYWLTWSVPLLVLVVDVIARLLMIESPHESSSDSSSEVVEVTSLLPQRGRSDSHDTSTTIGFWRFMLSDIRVVATLIVAISCTGINTSFHTTLALHIQDAFGWGTSRVGFMFFLLAMPAILLGPFAGMLRDRVGVKIPATISLVLQAMMMGLLGAAGNPNLPWAGFQNRGPALFVAGIIAMGTLRPFVSGIGPVELAAVVKAHEKEEPGIFGPRGGYSRIFSMTDVAAHTGLTIGPVVSGALSQQFGYATMSWTLGSLFLSLAILVLIFVGSGSRSNGRKAKTDQKDLDSQSV